MTGVWGTTGKIIECCKQVATLLTWF